MDTNTLTVTGIDAMETDLNETSPEATCILNIEDENGGWVSVYRVPAGTYVDTEYTEEHTVEVRTSTDLYIVQACADGYHATNDLDEAIAEASSIAANMAGWDDDDSAFWRSVADTIDESPAINESLTERLDALDRRPFVETAFPVYNPAN